MARIMPAQLVGCLHYTQRAVSSFDTRATGMQTLARLQVCYLARARSQRLEPAPLACRLCLLERTCKRPVEALGVVQVSEAEVSRLRAHR